MTDSGERVQKVRRGLLAGLGMTGVLGLAGCSGISFGPDIGTSNFGTGSNQPPAQLPTASGETLGKGSVRVALLLPQTGSLASVGTAMANGARLAMSFIDNSSTVGDNITLVIKDTGGNAQTAAALANQAVKEGAKLILGPLRSDAVEAAGAVAKSAGIPLIGFSNNPEAASPGVYLLNVLPQTEVKRSLMYAKAQGRVQFAAIIPTTSFGKIQEAAFRAAAPAMGINTAVIYDFSTQDQAQSAVTQLAPLISSGQVNALFLPDRATAPSIALMLEQAGIAKGAVSIFGSADWEGDLKIRSTPYLVGALYPAVDKTGQSLLRPDYVARFGTEPHALTSIAYTATLLANSSRLALATPPYDKGQLTRPSGFNGRDGLFRFLADGTSEYALVINQVVVGGAQQVDGAKLPS